MNVSLLLLSRPFPMSVSSFFRSPSKVFLRVIFGLPCFLLPGGFHLKPFLGILFCSILSTCPCHLCLLSKFQVIHNKLENFTASTRPWSNCFGQLKVSQILNLFFNQRMAHLAFKKYLCWFVGTFSPHSVTSYVRKLVLNLNL